MTDRQFLKTNMIGRLKPLGTSALGNMTSSMTSSQEVVVEMVAWYGFSQGLDALAIIMSVVNILLKAVKIYCLQCLKRNTEVTTGKGADIFIGKYPPHPNLSF